MLSSHQVERCSLLSLASHVCYWPQICRCWTGRACPLCPGISDVDLFRYREGIIDLDAGVIVRTHEEPEQPSLRLHGHINEQQIFDNPLEANFQGKLRVRAIGQVNGLLIPTSGTLRWSMTLEGRELAQWPIEIVHLGPQVDLFSTPPTPQPIKPNER
jgi:hypothetical protein